MDDLSFEKRLSRFLEIQKEEIVKCDDQTKYVYIDPKSVLGKEIHYQTAILKDISKCLDEIKIALADYKCRVKNVEVSLNVTDCDSDDLVIKNRKITERICSI